MRLDQMRVDVDHFAVAKDGFVEQRHIHLGVPQKWFLSCVVNLGA
jgi:hypothetical protein